MLILLKYILFQMKRTFILFWLALLLPIVSFAQNATVSDSAFYLPRIHPNDQIVAHTGFTLCYDEKYEQASWVAYQLTREETYKIAGRTNRFYSDPLVTTGSASDVDYKGSGFDRGHLAPAADMGWSTTTMAESFYYSNMSPQAPSFNRGIWKKLEELVRSWAINYHQIEVVTGPILEPDLAVIGPNQVAVPRFYYKVILDNNQLHRQAIGFILPNQESQQPLLNFAVSVDSVENRTGIDFFPILNDEIENRIEKNVCTSCWDWNKTLSYDQQQRTSNHSSVNISTNGSENKLMVTVQCAAMTKAGNRCRRMTKNKSGICWQHERINENNQH